MMTIRMTKVEESLAKQAMSGEQGEVLIDLITDNIVLADAVDDQHKAGAGIVLKFLRSLHNDTNLIESKPTE